MKTKTLLSVIAVAVIFASLAAPVSADQPRMQAAKVELQKAQNSLRKASADKGGHRERALDLIAKALTAVDNGIDFDRTHFTPGRRRHDSDFDKDNFQPATPPLDQPHMMNARAFLQNAIANLERASEDKGGYRQQALGFARQALEEVNAGIEYDRRH